GRHNAFDKVVGVALREGIDLRDVMVYSSGRLPVDMVMKAIRAGIPILATKAVPTDETIRLARKYRLTLLCQARPDSVLIYHDPLDDVGLFKEGAL
ncbi:formate dehydrogenase accessory sulfurtransferase FdhD, partial [uncultured Adlercreutzia sp.]